MYACGEIERSTNKNACISFSLPWTECDMVSCLKRLPWLPHSYICNKDCKWKQIFLPWVAFGQGNLGTKLKQEQTPGSPLPHVWLTQVGSESADPWTWSSSLPVTGFSSSPARGPFLSSHRHDSFASLEVEASSRSRDTWPLPYIWC